MERTGLKCEAKALNMQSFLSPENELWENDPIFHLICYLSKLFPSDFMVTVTCPKSSLEKQDVHFVNKVSVQPMK